MHFGRLIIEHASILTLDAPEKVQYLQDSTIIIEGDLIKTVLEGTLPSSSRLLTDYVINASKKLAMPGLVDLHFHIGLMRSPQDHLPPLDLINHCWDTSVRALNPQEVYEAALASYLAAMKCGTTQVNVMYRHLPSIARAAEDIGIRGTLSCEVALAKHNFDVLAINATAFEVCHQQGYGRIKANLGIECLQLVDEALLKEASELTKSYGKGVHIHLNESPAEIEDSIKRFGKRPTEVAHDFGVLGPNSVVAHAAYLSPNETALLAQTQTSLSHNPSSDASSASTTKLSELLDAGINVGLGHASTDGYNSNSLFQVMKSTAIVYRALNPNLPPLSPSQIIRMATCNGAKALGVNSGVLAPGYKADIILLDLLSPSFVPLEEGNVDQIMSHIVYSADGDVVDTSIIDGWVVMQNRRLTLVDEAQVLEDANQAFLRVKARLEVKQEETS